MSPTRILAMVVIGIVSTLACRVSAVESAGQPKLFNDRSFQYASRGVDYAFSVHPSSPFMLILSTNHARYVTFYDSSAFMTFCVSRSDVTPYLEMADEKNGAIWELYQIQSRPAGKEMWAGRRIKAEKGPSFRVDIFYSKEIDVPFSSSVNLLGTADVELIPRSEEDEGAGLPAKMTNIACVSTLDGKFQYWPLGANILNIQTDKSRENVTGVTLTAKPENHIISYYIVTDGVSAETGGKWPQADIAEALTELCALVRQRLAFDGKQFETDHTAAKKEYSLMAGKMDQALNQTAEKSRNNAAVFEDWINLGKVFREYEESVNALWPKSALNFIFKD